MPDSSVLQLLTQGQVAHDHPDLQDPARVLPYSSTIRHSLNLASAYSLCTGTEPAYTNYTSTYQGVLDYIFVSEGLLTALSVHEVLPPDAVGAPLPNPQQPSDHVSIAVNLRLGGPTPQGATGTSSSDGWAS
jgi:CCR4-NOT transcription complex subunit 6